MVAILLGAILTSTLAFVLLVRQLNAHRMRYVELGRAKKESDALNRALAKSESRLQAILENARDAILVVADRGGVRLANAACERLFGAPSDGLLGRQPGELLPGIELGTGDVRGMTARRLDGSEFPAELSVGSYDLDGEDGRVLVLRDVTERQRLERLKAEFVSTISHELRTPLTSIRASLGLLTAGGLDQASEKVRNLVRIANKNSIRLTDLINDLLDIERIESERSKFEHRPLDLASVVGQAIDAGKGLAAERDVELRLASSPDEALEVRGDESRLAQVLANLISNAVKFSPPGGTVELSLSRKAEDAKVAVRDFGPGIQEAFRPHIFSRFAQADSSDDRCTGGTGLGLNISQAILRRHGGRIGFESPLPGGGSRFWFTLPLVSDPPATDGLAARGHAVASDASSPVGPGAARSADAMAGDRSRPQSAAGRIGPSDEDGLPRILYVEDDTDMISVVAAILDSTAEIVPAHSLSEARARLEDERLALAIIDIELPDGSGYELLDAVHSLSPPPPVLMLSASECEEPYAGAVSAALVKGRFDHEELFHTVLELLGKRARSPFPRADDDAQPLLLRAQGSRSAPAGEAPALQESLANSSSSQAMTAWIRPWRRSS